MSGNVSVVGAVDTPIPLTHLPITPHFLQCKNDSSLAVLLRLSQ